MTEYSSTVYLLQEAVSIASVNPSHENDPRMCGERNMADWLQQKLEDRGLTVEMLDLLGSERPAVLGRTQVSDPKRSLMIEVHLDTVGVSGMTIDPFAAEIRDGKLYGRGSSDMKGSTCAMLAALTPERVRSLAARGVDLLIVGAPDEETGLGGSRILAEQGVHADDAMILEPTRCRPVIAHKGAYWYDVVLTGVAGHGSQPDQGMSTHKVLGGLLQQMQKLHTEVAEAFPHPLLDRSTLNIGRIEGGRTYNVIPDHTRILLDRRVVPGEDPAIFADRVQEQLDHLVDSGKLVTGEITCTNRTPAFSSDPDSDLVRSLQQAIGPDAAPCGTSWISDASMFSPICGNTVVFGPGDIAQAHTVDEYIELAELERGREIFERFLDQYSGV